MDEKGEAEQMEIDGLETYGDGLMVVSSMELENVDGAKKRLKQTDGHYI